MPNNKNKNKKQKVAVAMSGGVDSSVTAFLLQKKGYEVMGVYMRLGIDNKKAENAARKVCEKLNIKFYPLNIASEFKKEVKNYFIDSYKNGLTPNPCVNCNKFIKFGELLKRSEEIGADYLATGHYVKNQKSPVKQVQAKIKKQKTYKIFRAEDDRKDQSYFLYNLNQDILKKVLFPMGNYKKKDVKKIALENNLPTLESESQDICFLSGDHNDYLKDNIILKKGKIVLLTSSSVPLLVSRGKGAERQGEVIGEHNGLPLYTIGQRRGVEIGGTGPYYVVKIDHKTNTLYVSGDQNDPLLYADKLIAKDVNWISGNELRLPYKCKAIIRYGHNKEVDCEISSNIKNKYIIKFKDKQRAITPGQSVVFYNKDELIGGGVIN